MSKVLQQKNAAEPKTRPDLVSLRVDGLNLELGSQPVLRDICFNLPDRGMMTLIGPSGAGKSSLLRCLNRLYDGWGGEIRLNGRPTRHWPGGGDALRSEIGLIAQKPAVFPCSVRENVLFGLPVKQRRRTGAGQVEACLRQAALWDEVAHRLHDRADTLSIGQQQRLCLARALILSPSILLLDEPTASLDPRSKQLIELSLRKLTRDMPILCVTHDIEQARRLAGQVIFMCEGRIIEIGDGDGFFSSPERLETREFLRWSVCDCD